MPSYRLASIEEHEPPSAPRLSWRVQPAHPRLLHSRIRGLLGGCGRGCVKPFPQKYNSSMVSKHWHVHTKFKADTPDGAPDSYEIILEQAELNDGILGGGWRSGGGPCWRATRQGIASRKLIQTMSGGVGRKASAPIRFTDLKSWLWRLRLFSETGPGVDRRHGPGTRILPQSTPVQ